MGYVTDGRFSIRMGRAGGMGWIVAPALVQLISSLYNADNKHKQIHVLVRNRSNLQYRWARLVVLKLC